MTRLPAPDDERWLVKTVFSRWRSTGPAAVLMIIAFVCNGVVPVVIGQAIDTAIAPSDFRQLLLWLGVFAAVYGTHMVVGYFGRVLMQRSILRVGHDLRMAVTDRIQHPRGLGGQKRTAGELLSIASSDTQRVADAVFMTVFPFAEISLILYTGVMLLLIDVPLGVAVLIGGPVVASIALQAATPLRKASAKRQRALARASSMATDVVHGLRIVKGLGAAGTVRHRYGQVSDKAYERTVGANAAQARLNAVTETVGAIYVIVIAVIAGYLAINRIITVGELITAIGLTQAIIHPMTMFGRNIASRWAPAQASAQRIRAVLTAPYALPEETQELAPFPPGLTVISGAVPDDLVLCPRDRVVVAPRQADLFDGSVVDNVHSDRPTALTSLTVASADDIPGGPDRRVGENGRNLSGGQRQRVALARAIASDPQVLILQDPTTAVDSVTEQRIAERVADHRGRAITLVFSNAPAWSAVADQVYQDASDVVA